MVVVEDEGRQVGSDTSWARARDWDWAWDWDWGLRLGPGAWGWVRVGWGRPPGSQIESNREKGPIREKTVLPRRAMR